MSTSVARVKEHDIVRLKDGREGTVLSISFKDGKTACFIEAIGDEDNMFDVLLDDIEAVIWKSKE